MAKDTAKKTKETMNVIKVPNKTYLCISIEKLFVKNGWKDKTKRIIEIKRKINK